MEFTSNIRQLIENLKMIEKEVPLMLARIMESGAFFNLLKTTARTTLEAHLRKAAGGLAGPDLRVIEDEFIEAVTHGLARRVTRTGVEFTATPVVATEAPSLADAAELNLGAHTKTGKIKKTFRKFDEGGGETGDSFLDDDDNLKSVRTAILEWVKTEKKKDARDAGKSDEQIASDLMYILGIHDSRRPNADSDLRREAAEHLRPHIEDFIERAARGEVSGLETKLPQIISPETLREWLLAVGEAWRIAAPEWLRSQIEIELNRLADRFK